MKANSQALGADIQFGALSKVKLYSNKINKLQKCKWISEPYTLHLHVCTVQSIANSDINLSAAIAGSQTLQLQKDALPNLASTSGGHRENWGESNMAEGSADTSTDDTEDKNQMVIALL